MSEFYTPPMILAEVDDDIIHARMMENLPPDIDKTDGGFAHDFTRPAALEKAELMIAINDAIQIFFPQWSYGTFLDKIASGVGVTRRSATAAAGRLTIEGVAGKTIPIGFRFATPSTAIAPNIEYEAVEAKTIDATGQTSIMVRCTQTGPIGNIPANSITLMSAPTGGILSITNPEAMTGGADDEDDDALRARVIERDRTNESSYVGNNNDYIRWAKEVDGVGDVMVVPEWAGAGSGTVKLIVMDTNGAPANQTILDAVYDHIISPDSPDERLAPTGAILTAATATPIAISVSATVTLEPTANITAVKAGFETKLFAYFAEAKAESSVRFTRVGSMLSETAGVLDYTGLTINGAAANIEITVDDYPTIGTTTLTEAV